MKDKGSLHLKVQELCDCFATTDPLREMSILPTEANKDEGALKWIALAILHGINDNAKEIAITRAKDGKVAVTAKYRKAVLPSPGGDIGSKVFDVVKGVLHLEGKKGGLPLAVGVRDSSLELKVDVDSDGDGETVTIAFPK